MPLRVKVFHNDPEFITYPAIVLDTECTECQEQKDTLVTIDAEINAGEVFNIHICRDCLVELIAMIDNDPSH